MNVIERYGIEIRYLRVSSGPQRGKYVHQLVAEALLGRPLAADEEVDHLDGNTLNNAWSNIQVISTSAHATETNRRRFDKNQRRRDARRTETARVED